MTTAVHSTGRVHEKFRCPKNRRCRSDSIWSGPTLAPRTNQANRSTALGRTDRVRTRARLLHDRKTFAKLDAARAIQSRIFQTARRRIAPDAQRAFSENLLRPGGPAPARTPVPRATRDVRPADRSFLRSRQLNRRYECEASGQFRCNLVAPHSTKEFLDLPARKVRDFSR